MTRLGIRSLVAILTCGCTALSCSRGSGPSTGASKLAEGAESLRLSARPQPRFPSSAKLYERRGAGRVAYLGFDLQPPGPLVPGEVAEVRHYFQAEAPLLADYAVAVELRAPGSAAALASDAHRPVGGKAPTSAWKAGDIWADVHKLRVPRDLKVPVAELMVALVNGGERMTVEAAAGRSDGNDFVRAATVSVDASQAVIDDGLPVVTIPRATSTITADGVLGEAAWATAPILTFSDTMGRDVPTRSPTQLKLLWDDTNLYVGFESVDRDITCPYVKRDDPIYDHETVEVFMMPGVIAPGLGPYVELQASPKGIIFDAAFTARRQGMDKSFDAGQTVGTTVRGTLNAPTPDEGWTSEWIVPWSKVRYVARPPKVGDEWRMNAFRIDKSNGEGEYTAWSPPRVGDFHAVDKFGRMRFGK